MECVDTIELSNAEFLAQFRQKAVQQRIPTSGMIALTYRCNLQCIHCYLGQERTNQGYELELSTAQWHKIIDEITAAGCLTLTITGGEPLLRHDFADLYAHARTNGMLITIFTNGTLITDDLLELFQELPPTGFDISLYGATAATYESITGVQGSYERCMQGIRQLIEHQIPVSLKTILMTPNRHEFYEIEKIAEEYGVKFRFDPAIIPCLNGDNAPIDLRVPPEEAVEKAFSNEERVQAWKKFFERRQDYHVIDDALYQCGSGRSTFYIDPYGNLQPCLMMSSIQYDLKDGDFLTGWNEVIPQIREKKAPKNFRCHLCEHQMVCGYCPPVAGLETGAEGIPSEYLCRLGQSRFNAIKSINKEKRI